MAEAKEVAQKEQVKEVEIELSRDYTTNGKVFKAGKITVPEDVAEDLLRREKEFDAYEKSLIRNNGREIDALNGETLKG